jgi:hypothetical protein
MKATQVHYDNGKDYDIIDVCNDYSLNFNRGNILKYIVRAERLFRTRNKNFKK